MAPADVSPRLRVEVAYSPRAGEVARHELELAEGATVRDALQASGLLTLFTQVENSTLALGVWGTLRGLDDVLRDRDRVELYRPLLVDPKEARRQRYRSHRDKTRK